MLAILYYTLAFSLSDYIFTKFNVKGIYYLNHIVNNVVVVYECLPIVYMCYTDFLSCLKIDLPINCMYMTIALHLYHILLYFNSLRFDDWLHHIVMIGFVMPIICSYNTGGGIIGHGMFYVTGLPGAIDYSLLFLNRNNDLLVTRYQEKYINSLLNLWIRCPGCITTGVFLLLMTQFQETKNDYDIYVAYAVIAALYWNGIYFMNDVLKNYYSVRLILTAL